MTAAARLGALRPVPDRPLALPGSAAVAVAPGVRVRGAPGAPVAAATHLRPFSNEGPCRMCFRAVHKLTHSLGLSNGVSHFFPPGFNRDLFPVLVMGCGSWPAVVQEKYSSASTTNGKRHGARSEFPPQEGSSKELLKLP